MKLKGPNLTDSFISYCKKQGLLVRIVESRSGSSVYLKIKDRLCYLKYANLSSAGHYYFGFATKDVKNNFKESTSTIIVCGEGRIDHVYMIPSNVLADFLREGKPVGKNRAVYEEYQAKIFPDRNFDMTVTHRNADPIDIRQYEVRLNELTSISSVM